MISYKSLIDTRSAPAVFYRIKYHLLDYFDAGNPPNTGVSCCIYFVPPTIHKPCGTYGHIVIILCGMLLKLDKVVLLQEISVLYD